MSFSKKKKKIVTLFRSQLILLMEIKFHDKFITCKTTFNVEVLEIEIALFLAMKKKWVH